MKTVKVSINLKDKLLIEVAEIVAEELDKKEELDWSTDKYGWGNPTELVSDDGVDPEWYKIYTIDVKTSTVVLKPKF